MTKRIVCLIVCSLFALGALPVLGQSARLQARTQPLPLFVYNTLTYPGSSETEAHAIDGKNVVGYYKDDSGNGHGFLYDGCIYKPIDVPQATFTSAEGINGSSIVGYYVDSNHKVHGFLYNGVTYQTMDVPGAANTYANGVSGKYVVGYYEDASENRTQHGFFYDGLTSIYKTIDAPGSVRTNLNGISGNLIVGFFTIDVGYTYGCIYDLTPNPNFPPPNFVKSLSFNGSADTTFAYGIYGNTIVGVYDDPTYHSHGFSYDNAANIYATIDKSDSNITYPMGIYRNVIVGAYSDNRWRDWQGFTRYVNPKVTGNAVLKPQSYCQ